MNEGMYMKDLMTLVEICKTDLDSLEIKYGKINGWSINYRAKCRLGQCKVVSTNTFDINISEAILQDNVDDQIALNTIMHELLHTVKGCFNHGSKWKMCADLVNTKLPQYNIKRVATRSETNLLTERKPPVYKYTLRCIKCGQEIKRQKESKVIKNYKRYRCGKCGGKFEKIL